MAKWQPPQWPDEIKKPEIKSILARANVHLSARLCLKCPFVEKRWSESGHGEIRCRKKIPEGPYIEYITNIGWWEDEHGYVQITGKGIPIGCPFELEYMMHNQAREEAREKMTLKERVIEVARNRCDEKYRPEKQKGEEK